MPAWKEVAHSLWGNFNVFFHVLECLLLDCLFLSLVQVYLNDVNFEENLQKIIFFGVLHFAPILSTLKDCISQCLYGLFRAVLSNIAYYLYGQRGCQCQCIFQEESSSPFFPLNYAHWTFPLRDLSKIHLV